MLRKPQNGLGLNLVQGEHLQQESERAVKDCSPSSHSLHSHLAVTDPSLALTTMSSDTDTPVMSSDSDAPAHSQNPYPVNSSTFPAVGKAKEGMHAEQRNECVELDIKHREINPKTTETDSSQIQIADTLKMTSKSESDAPEQNAAHRRVDEQAAPPPDGTVSDEDSDGRVLNEPRSNELIDLFKHSGVTTDDAQPPTAPPVSVGRKRKAPLHPEAKKRRGNLPKAATMKLKRWLASHISNPYPTDDQKRKLSVDLGLSVAQISNWFINARRRIVNPTKKQANMRHMMSNGIQQSGAALQVPWAAAAGPRGAAPAAYTPYFQSLQLQTAMQPQMMQHTYSGGTTVVPQQFSMIPHQQPMQHIYAGPAQGVPYTARPPQVQQMHPVMMAAPQGMSANEYTMHNNGHRSLLYVQQSDTTSQRTSTAGSTLKPQIDAQLTGPKQSPYSQYQPLDPHNDHHQQNAVRQHHNLLHASQQSDSTMWTSSQPLLYGQQAVELQANAQVPGLLPQDAALYNLDPHQGSLQLP